MLHAPEGVARQGLRHVQAVWLPEGVRRGEGVRHLWHADVRARAEDQGHVEKYMTKVDKYRKDEKLTALNYEAMQSATHKVDKEARVELEIIDYQKFIDNIEPDLEATFEVSSAIGINWNEST